MTISVRADVPVRPLVLMYAHSMRKEPIVIITTLLATIATIFYWPILTGARGFFLGDITAFFEPLTSYMVRRIHSGEWPLWNPFVYCGMPQIAVQSPSLCSPFTWLFIPLDFNRGLASVMILLEVLAGLGACLLSRTLGMSLAACVFAASLAAFNGYIFSLGTNWTLAAGVAVFPWLILCLHRAATIGGAHNIAALAMTSWIFITTGRPEVIAPGAVVALLYWLITLKAKRGNAVVTAALLGVLLSMPMLLPAAEWLPLSRRASGLDPHETAMLSANWYDFAKLTTFPWLGDARLGEGDTIPAVHESGSLFLASSFIGPIALILALIALSESNWKGRVWLIGSAVVAALFIAGLIPLPGLVRFPIKLMWLLMLVLIVAATRGISSLSNPKLTWTLCALSTISLLVNASMVARHWTSPTFFESRSIVAARAKAFNIDPQSHRLTTLFHRHCFAGPEKVCADRAADYDRQLLYPNTNIDYSMPSATGFEGACTGVYYRTFLTLLAKSTQSTGLIPDAPDGPKSDSGLAALLSATSSAVVVSQARQYGPSGRLIDVPLLSNEDFRLIADDAQNNLRYYTPLYVQPRVRTTSGTTKLLLDAPEEIRIETNSNTPSTLTVADQFYPGWYATTDGAPTAIQRTNQFFRSVSIPAGKHIVSMSYSPWSWRSGLICASLAAVIIAAMLIIPHRWRFLA